MSRSLNLRRTLVAIASTAFLLGCEKQPAAKTTTPAPAETEKPSVKQPAEQHSTPRPHEHEPQADKAPVSQPPISDPHQASASKPEMAPGAMIQGSTLSLTGVTLTVPQGWESQPVKPGGMGPKAVFTLPPGEGEQGTCSVRITHFPGMKGMDEMNISRWLNQVKDENGRPTKRDSAKITEEQIGQVGLKIVEATGTLFVDTRMGPSTQSGQESQRLIAAIVNHPQGPHFIKASGPSEAMARWQDSIHQFMRSVNVGP